MNIRHLWVRAITPIIMGMGLILCITIPTHAAEFLSGDTINISESKENLYAAGSTINVTSPVSKDLVVAGSTISVTANVERDVIIAGGDITIDASEIGGAVRVAGGKVTLKGAFKDDVIVAAGQLDITDATIDGDLIVAVNSLSIENSQIQKSLQGSYVTSSSDFTSQVAGQVNLKQSSQENRTKSFGDYVDVAGEFSVIVGLAITVYILNRRKRLEDPEIKLNSRFGFDFLIGLGLTVLPLFVIFVSVFVLLYPLTITLTGLIYFGFTLSSIFLPLYIANFLKNVFNIKFNFIYLIVATYIVLLLLKVLSVAVPIVLILLFIPGVFSLAQFGYLTRNLLSLINKALAPRDSETITQEPEKTF